MNNKIENIRSLIGNTPFQRLNTDYANVYAKLEYFNFSGSIKDRAALNIITKAIDDGEIVADTNIVESSSGNFAIALSMLCKALGLHFTAVVDPNINVGYEKNLRLLCNKVIKVVELDPTGGYLLTRVKAVKDICDSHNNYYWPNQYGNKNNYLGYYHQLGDEICNHFNALDYAFIAVSSGGTVTGLSRRLKEKFPNVEIIAVDVEGSVIFDNVPQKRHLSGIGSSKVPKILENALIDRVIHLSELEIIEGCYELLNEQNIFGGVSSGAAYKAVKDMLKSSSLMSKPNVLFIVPDRGNAYIDTVYNERWVEGLRHDLASVVG